MTDLFSLPDVPEVKDRALHAFLVAVKEHLEVREGLLGDDTTGDKLMTRSGTISLLVTGASDFTRLRLTEGGAIYFGLNRRLVHQSDGDLSWQERDPATDSWTETAKLAG